MSATSMTAAVQALEAEQREQALAALLEVWRSVRHPRIANVIDYVSDELVAKQPPIKAKTKAALATAWHELEQRRDPATLGRLLATSWPGTWQKALPILEPLCQWPDDPRLAMAFARIVDECPYDTWTSSSFYVPLLRKLEAQRDLRVLPLLRAQLQKHRSRYYQRSVQPYIVRVLVELERRYPGDAPPALDDDVEAALARIEARYRDRIEGAHEKLVGQVDHMAAILADPDDLAARAVFADWLGERGDPRGELITLQLARAANYLAVSDAAIVREKKLLDEHGTQWAGALDAWFEEDDRIFEGGFFAGGGLRYQYCDDSQVDRMVRDPAWALVRVIDSRSNEALLRELMERPELRSLREVRTEYATAIAIATGSPRQLTALHWWGSWDPPSPPPLEALATCDALPALREVGFESKHVELHVAWLAEAPVVERLARIVVGNADVRYLQAAAKRGGALREVELDLQPSGYRGAGWRFLLQRDIAPGPFTRCIVRPRGGPHDPGSLAAVLQGIPTDWLRELVITTPRKLAMPKAERAELVAAIEAFTNLERRELPWRELATPAPTAPSNTVEVPAGPQLWFRVDGESLFTAEQAETVWRMVNDELGLQYDSFEISSRWRALGDDPVARIKTWANNKRRCDMTLYRDGVPGRLVLSHTRSGRPLATTLLLAPVGTRSYEDLVAWYLRFLALGTFDSGTVYLEGVERDLGSFQLHEVACGVTAGWLVFFGPVQQPLLPPARVAALASRPGLDGLFVRETSTGLLVGLARTPQEVTPERLVAASAGLREILVEQLVDKLGLSLEARVLAVVEPVAAALELAHVRDASQPFRIRFAAPDERSLQIELHDLYRRPRLLAHLYRPRPEDDFSKHHYPLDTTIGSPAELDAALATAATAIAAQAPGFFAGPG